LGIGEYYPAVVALQIRFAPTGIGEYYPAVVALQNRFAPFRHRWGSSNTPNIRFAPSGTGECYPAVVARYNAIMFHCITFNAQYAVHKTTQQIAYAARSITSNASHTTYDILHTARDMHGKLTTPTECCPQLQNNS
jgi:hypothetical protein